MESINFIVLTESEKIEYINKQLKEGVLLGSIAKELGKSPSWLSQHLSGLGYIYDRTLRRYDLKGNSEEISNGKKEIRLDREYAILKKRQFTVALPDRVIKEWKEFCNYNFIYRGHDLLTMALVEYMNKYKGG